MINEFNILQLSIIFLCIIFCIEALIRFPLSKYIKDLHLIILKIFKILRSCKISDHWKELVLKKYANILFLKSIFIMIFIILGLMPLVLTSWLILGSIENLLHLISDFYFLFLSVVISFIYIICRAKLNV